METATLIQHHFFDSVVSYPGLRVFFFHAEFHNISAYMGHSVITTRLINELFEKDIIIAGVVRDNLFCQQAGLPLMMESVQYPRIKGLIILPCVNHILNMFLPNSIKGNEEFVICVEVIQIFQAVKDPGCISSRGIYRPRVTVPTF
jgi:hypothetical protein